MNYFRRKKKEIFEIFEIDLSVFKLEEYKNLSMIYFSN